MVMPRKFKCPGGEKENISPFNYVCMQHCFSLQKSSIMSYFVSICVKWGYTEIVPRGLTGGNVDV